MIPTYVTPSLSVHGRVKPSIILRLLTEKCIPITNLVANATVFGVKSAAKVLHFFDICKR